jgi:hypothetical protein
MSLRTYLSALERLESSDIKIGALELSLSQIEIVSRYVCLSHKNTDEDIQIKSKKNPKEESQKGLKCAGLRHTGSVRWCTEQSSQRRFSMELDRLVHLASPVVD